MLDCTHAQELMGEQQHHGLHQVTCKAGDSGRLQIEVSENDEGPQSALTCRVRDPQWLPSGAQGIVQSAQ